METEISNPQSHIFLVGFMACGKSTMGPVLAAKLNRPFHDLDRQIEAQAGCTIAELLVRVGEEQFRQIETVALRKAAHGKQAVIAPGGGAIIRSENRELMFRHGIIVWLDVPVDLCWQRIKQDGVVRPLAPDKDTMLTKYHVRLPLYSQAEVRIAINESQSPEEIAAEVVEHLRLLKSE